MRFGKYIIEEQSPYVIYTDLDGVLVDFIAGVNKLFQIDISGFEQWNDIKKDHWESIANKGSDFWYELPWTKDGHILWNHIKKYEPMILTAYPINPKGTEHAKVGKRRWVKHNLGDIVVNRTITCKGIDKQTYATSTSILIDDSKRNIDQWKSKGGIGILHKNSLNTIKELDNYITKGIK